MMEGFAYMLKLSLFSFSLMDSLNSVREGGVGVGILSLEISKEGISVLWGLLCIC